MYHGAHPASEITPSQPAMQDMQQQEAEHIALHSAEAVQERRQSLAAGMLPRAFDALRNVFGTSGPVCRPQSEVDVFVCKVCLLLAA